jgi:hypothetical protein
MEFLGFAAVVLVFVVGGAVATRLLSRAERNQGDQHGGGLSSSVDATD